MASGWSFLNLYLGYRSIWGAIVFFLPVASGQIKYLEIKLSLGSSLAFIFPSVEKCMSVVVYSPEQPALWGFTHESHQVNGTQVPCPSVQILLLDEIIPLPGVSLGFCSPFRCPNISDASKHWLKLSLPKDAVGQIHDSSWSVSFFFFSFIILLEIKQLFKDSANTK